MLCSQHCSCTWASRTQGMGASRIADIRLIYSDLPLRQQETLCGERGLVQVQETVPGNTVQNLNYLSRLHILPLISVTLMVYLRFFFSSYLSSFILLLSAHFSFTKSKPRRSNRLVIQCGCIWTVHCQYHHFSILI